MVSDFTKGELVFLSTVFVIASSLLIVSCKYKYGNIEFQTPESRDSYICYEKCNSKKEYSHSRFIPRKSGHVCLCSEKPIFEVEMND